MLEILQIFTMFAGVVLVLLSHKFENSSYEQSMDALGIDVIGVSDFEDVLQRCYFDFVVLSYARIAEHIMPLAKRRFPGAKIIYDTVDVQFIRLNREFLVTHDKQIGKEAKRMERIEPRLAKAADQTWCVTSDDQEFLKSAAPAANIRVVPNIHEVQDSGLSFDERSDLLFIGNFEHRPNVDAVNLLLDEILPVLLEDMPDLKLHIVGGDMPAELSARQSTNFIVHGFVTDVAPLFMACRVFAAPLRFGGGMKGKIGQALSFGLPIVTTGVGAEGMNLIHGCNALIAESPAHIAANIMRVYHNEELWQMLSDNGRDLIAKDLSPEAVEKSIRRALDDLLPGRGISTL
jgi:glycosyltransferase involved in cell wall biosynthesis